MQEKQTNRKDWMKIYTFSEYVKKCHFIMFPGTVFPNYLKWKQQNQVSLNSGIYVMYQ